MPRSSSAFAGRSRRWRVRASGIILLVVVLASGCAKRSVPFPAGRATPAAGRLTAALVRQAAEAETVQALAAVTFRTPGGVERHEAAIVIARPDRLRIDLMDPLADVWAQAGSDGREVWLFLPREGRRFTGRRARRAMRRAVGAAWDPALLAALLGGVPPLGDAPLAEVDQGGEPLFVAADRRTACRADRTARRLQRCTVRAENEELVVTYGAYRGRGARAFPESIVVALPARGAMLAVDYRDVVRNEPIDPMVFAMPTGEEGR